uniref:Uncharacterized protein n=1 Tax=Romanomermis culicivorax TaxID=13658 RepID=A0A915KTR7_ROMCU
MASVNFCTHIMSPNLLNSRPLVILSNFTNELKACKRERWSSSIFYSPPTDGRKFYTTIAKFRRQSGHAVLDEPPPKGATLEHEAVRFGLTAGASQNKLCIVIKFQLRQELSETASLILPEEEGTLKISMNSSKEI